MDRGAAEQAELGESGGASAQVRPAPGFCVSQRVCPSMHVYETVLCNDGALHVAVSLWTLPDACVRNFVFDRSV